MPPMNYLIGDLQGCCDAFERLLAEIGFSPSRDTLHVLGDLVNRGPDSLGTLRRLQGLGDAPPGHQAWFDIPGRRTAGTPVAFGHWSTVGLLNRPDLLALDTGCVWGGALTAVRVDGGRREIVQVACAQAQRPG